MKGDQEIKFYSSILGGFILFIVFSYLVQTNIEFFRNYLLGENTTMTILVYILFTFLATVFAPISALPLMPLAANLWGANLAAIYSLIGWIIGSILAFSIARIYGTKILKKFFRKEKIEAYDKLIPKKNQFITIIILRIIFPTDILSYMLGLNKEISYFKYITATILGMIPFAFLLAYLGTVPFEYQIFAFLILLPILIAILYNPFRKNVVEKIKDSKEEKK